MPPTDDPRFAADLSPEERQDHILALLGGRRRLAVADLAAHFRTSEDSIRRDVRALAARGRIRRVHGAILPAAPSPTGFAERDGERAAAKARVAAAAARLVPDGATVLADGGTTVLAVLRALPPDRRLTVITPSLPAAEVLCDRPAVEAVLVGGSLDRASRTTVGAAAVRAVREVRADLCLLAPCSVDADGGVTAAGFEEAQVKRAMVDSAGSVIALATADKVGPASRFHVAPAAALSRLVVEAGADPDALAAIAGLGVDVLSA